MGGRLRDVGGDLYDIRRWSAVFGGWGAPSEGFWASFRRGSAVFGGWGAPSEGFWASWAELA